MRYAILANPASGTAPRRKKEAILEEVSRILGAGVFGLDTRTPKQLVECGRALVNHCDILVIAGGDGTFSDMINAIDTVETPVAFLPLGTGNALAYALGYRGRPSRIARQIKDGKIREHDLLECKGHKRGFMMSVGLEGAVVQLYDRYLSRGYGGLGAYLAGFMDAYFRKYKRAGVRITLDNGTFRTENLLSLMVVKQPYYGFRMNVVPGARFDDGLAHILCINSGLIGCAVGAATAFAGGNRIGTYATGHRVEIRAATPLPLQIDGDFITEAARFSFTVLPQTLRIKY